MKTVKTTLMRLAVYFFLLAVNIIPCGSIIPDVFPTRNISTIYLLTLSVCLIWYYSHRVSGSTNLSFMMKLLSWMAFLLILLRGIKYSVFAGVQVLARHTWYFYYVPMMLIPLCFFYVSLIILPEGGSRIPKKWFWTAFVTITFILLIITNDLHQQIFSFKPGFKDWDSEYSYGFMFYLITAWQYALYLAAVFILVLKCRTIASKKGAWLTAVPFLIGITMCVCLITEKMPKINGSYIIEFPEALIFMVAGVLECCMQLGLIPTNTGYGKLFGLFSLSAQITDKEGKPIYSSRSAVALTKEQFLMPDGARIGEHTVLHKMKVPGGFGFWQDDMTGIDRINEELTEAKEALSQKAELVRLKNELEEKQTKIEQRTVMYDTIAERTWQQSQTISRLAKKARLSSDNAVKVKCRNEITLFGSYIKRFANLMLLSYESKSIDTGELGLSFSEVLRYLNFCGIPGELVNTAEGTISSDAALCVFETFGKLLERNLSVLHGVFVNFSFDESAICKLTLENLRKKLQKEELDAFTKAGVKIDITFEDDITYIGFTLPSGGAAL